MTASEQFLRFAADCEYMAKFTHDPQNRPVWHRMAERWVRCAEMAERQSLAAQNAQLKKRAQATRTSRPGVTAD